MESTKYRILHSEIAHDDYALLQALSELPFNHQERNHYIVGFERGFSMAIKSKKKLGDYRSKKDVVKITIEYPDGSYGIYYKKQTNGVLTIQINPKIPELTKDK